MLRTNPESRVRPDPGMSSTGAFATPLGLGRAVGGLQKFRIGKVIGWYADVAANSFTKVALVLLNIPISHAVLKSWLGNHMLFLEVQMHSVTGCRLSAASQGF